MEKEIFTTNSEDETISLGFKMAKRLKKGDVVAFTGDLGAGKTEFIKGICSYFKVDEIVTSPTFTIINQYNGTAFNSDISIYHLDLYRINNIEELIEIGFDDCINYEESIKLIEWADNAGIKLQNSDYKIHFILSEEFENNRIIEITGNKN